MPKLQLFATHTHAGVVYPAGHVLDVDEYTARWLIDRRIGTQVSSEPAPATDSAPVTDSAKPTKTRKTLKE